MFVGQRFGSGNLGEPRNWCGKFVEGEFWRGCSLGRDLHLGISVNRETGIGSLSRGNCGGDVRWAEIWVWEFRRTERLLWEVCRAGILLWEVCWAGNWAREVCWAELGWKNDELEIGMVSCALGVWGGGETGVEEFGWRLSGWGWRSNSARRLEEAACFVWFLDGSSWTGIEWIWVPICSSMRASAAAPQGLLCDEFIRGEGSGKRQFCDGAE
jgi:hypothetical protein